VARKAGRDRDRYSNRPQPHSSAEPFCVLVQVDRPRCESSMVVCRAALLSPQADPMNQGWSQTDWPLTHGHNRATRATTHLMCPWLCRIPTTSRRIEEDCYPLAPAQPRRVAAAVDDLLLVAAGGRRRVHIAHRCRQAVDVTRPNAFSN